MNLEEFAKHLAKDDKPDVTPQQLREHLDSFETAHRFKRGDLVTWKPGLRLGQWPAPGQPAIVTRVLDTPVSHPDATPGSIAYNVRFDLRVGVIDGDGDFVEFLYDSRRMQPYTE